MLLLQSYSEGNKGLALSHVLLYALKASPFLYSVELFHCYCAGGKVNFIKHKKTVCDNIPHPTIWVKLPNLTVKQK